MTSEEGGKGMWQAKREARRSDEGRHDERRGGAATTRAEAKPLGVAGCDKRGERRGEVTSEGGGKGM